MAVEIFNQENIPEKDIPAHVEYARYKKLLKPNLTVGKVIRVGGAVDANVVEFARHTISQDEIDKAAASGQVLAILYNVCIAAVTPPEE